MWESHPLIPTLEVAVPLQILKIKKQGYVPKVPEDIEELISSHGDDLMFGGKRGKAAEIFNKLAYTLAIMSFYPGGVRIFGNHWISEL